MYAVQTESKAPTDIWGALADPTRRLLIDRLAAGPKTTSQLCVDMPMSRFGVMKHLGILERAGIVIARRHGRFRMNHLNAAPLRAIQTRWLSNRAARLADSMARLASTTGEEIMPTDLNATGIAEVALDWTVSASIQQVWTALFERPEQWWPAAHRAGGEGATMQFASRVGAQLREERPDGGGLIWYEVYALQPVRSVDLAGQLASRYGGPALSYLHLELAPGEVDGTTVIKLTDSLFGRIGPDASAALAEGWQAIIGDGLVAYVEAAKT
jgi:DNA-binding transcriptional ArsR family regulator